MRKSYVTSMPDQTGAFLLASKIIAKYNGNIVRVSYNKAVDLHMLFIDVEADSGSLTTIAKELKRIGYLSSNIPRASVIMVSIRVPDRSGALLPVLDILNSYDINISYMNASTANADYQDFKMGLLIENPAMIKELLDQISKRYQIDIIDYDDSEENLDNTIFYIRLANSMQKMLGLSTDKTMEFISESNRIMQTLQEKGENPAKVFDYIRRFASFISRHQGSYFKVDIEILQISENVVLYSIQPPCGSNTVVMDTGSEYVLVDTGYAIYGDEMTSIFAQLFPDWGKRDKRIYLTHADVDHCGLLTKLTGAKICLNQKSADSLRRQYAGQPDYREHSSLGLGYSKLSRIISGYIPPDPARFAIIDSDTPPEHETLLPIGSFDVADLSFEVLEGSGGHVYGEVVFLCREIGLVFTGDILVNIGGFTPDRAEFNSLAPYLMTSVNVDSRKATRMRKSVTALIEEIGETNHKPCIVCGGHGCISTVSSGKLINFADTQKLTLSAK